MLLAFCDRKWLKWLSQDLFRAGKWKDLRKKIRIRVKLPTTVVQTMIWGLVRLNAPLYCEVLISFKFNDNLTFFLQLSGHMAKKRSFVLPWKFRFKFCYGKVLQEFWISHKKKKKNQRTYLYARHLYQNPEQLKWKDLNETRDTRESTRHNEAKRNHTSPKQLK